MALSGKLMVGCNFSSRQKIYVALKNGVFCKW